MKNLLMITGLGSARQLAQGKQGAFYYTLEELHQYFQRIDIIAPGSLNDEEKVLFGNVHVYVIGGSLFLYPWRFIQKALSLFDTSRFDLMTVQEFAPFYNGIAARIIHWKTKVPYILEIHHVPGLPRSATLKEWFYKLLTHFFIALDALKAQAIRVVNQHQVANFLEQSGIPVKKIHYIPSLYIDQSVFRPLNIAKKFDVTFVGRLEPNKGLELFLETVRRLQCTACIVGSGSQYLWLKKCIISQHLEDRVTLKGWARTSTDIALSLNESRLLLMTSYNEGGPRVVAEALACGVPVVATRVGVVPDIIQEGESGMIADWSSKAIAKKASLLLNDKALYERVRTKGLQIVQNYERVKMIRTYADSLIRLLS